MNQQATWVPLPKKRAVKVKPLDAIERCERLANWYTAYKPSVERITVTKGDYAALEEAAGTHGISINAEGMRYRDFSVVIQK